MKSYDYDAVAICGEVFCVECLPDGVSVDSPEVTPIFADSEWQHYPVCKACGHVHDYVTLIKTHLGDDWKGSLSEGSLLPRDILSNCLPALEKVVELNPSYRGAATLLKEIRKVLDKPEDADVDELDFVVDDLFTVLNDFAPKGCYFGAHPGDGASIGFFEIEDGEE